MKDAEIIAQWIERNGPPRRCRVEMPLHMRGDRKGASMERRVNFRLDKRPAWRRAVAIRISDPRYIGTD